MYPCNSCNFSRHYLGPGRRESSNPSKPRRAAPSGPNQSSGHVGQDRQRTYSGSLKGFSKTSHQTQPHLPKSGAQHKAKRGSNVNPNADFMQTPDSGVCG